MSFAIISALVKDPTDSLSFHKEVQDIKKHKLGYFLAEEKEFKHISDVIGTSNQGEINRHPLTFMLEAADDIAYATADLEDAFKKGLFTLDAFINYFKKSIDQTKIREHASPEYYSNILIENLCDWHRKSM